VKASILLLGWNIAGLNDVAAKAVGEMNWWRINSENEISSIMAAISGWRISGGHIFGRHGVGGR